MRALATAKALFVMNMMNKLQLPGLMQPLIETTEYQSLLHGWERSFNQQMIFGLSGSQRSLLMSALSYVTDKPILIITPGEGEAVQLADDIYALLPEREVVIFPVWQDMPLEIYSCNKDVSVKRLKVLNSLSQGASPIIVAPIEALMRRLLPKEFLAKEFKVIKTGDNLNLEELQKYLLRMGYTREDLIQSVGQYSLRGGILDIYPLSNPMPIRVEFFGDEVESLRTFDPISQRSIASMDHMEITPAREMIISQEVLDEGIKRLKTEYQIHSKKIIRNAPVEAQHQLTAQVESWLTKLSQPIYFEGIEQLMPYFYPHSVNLMQHLPQGAPVMVDDPVRVKEVVEIIQKERGETHAALLLKGRLLPAQYEIYEQWKQILASIGERKSLYFSFLPRSCPFLRPQNVVNFNVKAMHAFLGNMDVLADEVKQWKRKNNAVVLLVGTRERAENLLEVLKDHKIDAFYISKLQREVKPGNVVITEGQISAGFEIMVAKLVVITEKEIFGRRIQPRYRQDRKDRRVAPLADLKVNDYVVHVNHGIGRYLGITNLDIGGLQRDYLIIKYAGDDKVYIPTDQVGMLQRYMGKEGIVPKLSKLGGNDWNKAKNKVRQAVKEIAGDLLKLYAARQTLAGTAYEKDTVWQKEFEDSFPYEETPDQIKAIEDVKRDMESSRPMDRLLCGDVGYGKTEVALRAAFKAVSSGKQVAVLVPTTILAQQHYNTFRERFSPYPVNIEVLSRFRSAKEQKNVLKQLQEGQVDIVIGTHRLVQQDVRFKDLGLVVVDEEQRFGVTHKEKLKQICKNVDVLTLTATPIPRTLHMSLAGVRDTSVLETPPEDRFPVQTYVLEEDAVMIREAIKREINRGGQIFYVHNRVADLDRVAQWLSELVPEARMMIAHGQMKEDELERATVEFVENTYDLLLCTTIIETGLDMPNVNTLIVKDADKFGLAQLYQLRGRVGRSNRMAYAYFTFAPAKVLTEESERRLAAIREFTELGSGYKIAMRDLEIRGAGNILGAEQHGHIAEVGFELYCRMLEEAVQEAKGEKNEERVETAVELPIDAYIPEEYIGDLGQKVEIYRRMASIIDEEQLQDLQEELEDRYGEIPGPVSRLLLVAGIKLKGNKLKIKNISQQKGLVRLTFTANPPLDPAKLVKIIQEYRNRIKYNNNDQKFEIDLKLRGGGNIDEKFLTELNDFVEKII